MKIPTKLLWRVLLDVGLQLSDTIDIDYREICRRYEREGMSFLTITLPLLDEALIRGLTRGYLTRSDFVGFRPRSRRGSLPALLSGFFRLVFHDDGSVRSDPSTCAIFAIRQVTRLFKKVELPCSSPRIKAAYERYQSNDREVDWRSHRKPLDSGIFTAICGLLWADLEDLSEAFYCSPGIFGSGATSERLKRNERYEVKEWPVRAENSFPASYHAVHREDADALKSIEFLAADQERPVRVVQVPKTLKTPRTISVEPSYMMLMQQSIAKPLMAYLESKRFGFQSVRFTDQSVNANLARLGSIDGSLATIDLKDASDMVDLDLVKYIFSGPCPTFLNYILDCRTTRAKLPDGTIIPLKKFASMGSALCFPIESMVFFTVVLYALVKNSGKVPSRRLLRELAKDVAIYGDDIIVKSSMAPVVIDTLEDFGLRVNRDKSFHTGLFRESCGGDYYAGVDVTPTYVRQWDDTGSLRASSHKVAYVALSNTLYVKGLWNACQYLRDEISLRLSDDIPQSQYPIGVLHYISFVRSSKLCYDSKIHGYRVKGYRIRVSREIDAPSNMEGSLYRAFQPRFFEEGQKLHKESFSCSTTRKCIRLARSEYARDLRFTELDAYFDDLGIPRSSSSQVREQSEAVHQERWTDYYPLTHQRYSSMLGGSDSSLYRDSTPEPHGRLLPWVRSGSRLGPLLDHLRGPRRDTITLSDRPHALSLKRGWTASPAGLQW